MNREKWDKIVYILDKLNCKGNTLQETYSAAKWFIRELENNKTIITNFIEFYDNAPYKPGDAVMYNEQNFLVKNMNVKHIDNNTVKWSELVLLHTTGKTSVVDISDTSLFKSQLKEIVD